MMIQVWKLTNVFFLILSYVFDDEIESNPISKRTPNVLLIQSPPHPARKNTIPKAGTYANPLLLLQ